MKTLCINFWQHPREILSLSSSLHKGNKFGQLLFSISSNLQLMSSVSLFSSLTYGLLFFNFGLQTRRSTLYDCIKMEPWWNTAASQL